MIDRILLGDNPFIGVDHMSQERARDRGGFTNAERVVDIIQYASDLGVNGFVASTHPNLRKLIDYMTIHTDLHKRINFYPIIPYVQGYVTRMTEKGLVVAITSVLESPAVKDKIRIIMKGGMGLIRKDIYELFKILIDTEVLQLNNVRTNIVFLHDVLTDLALSLGLKDFFEIFIAHIADTHNAKSGFVTKNFPRLVRQLDRWNIPIPPIMTSFNKVGFQMNPSREECEKCLSEYNIDVIAMSTLAAGYLSPGEAYEYLFRLPNIRSVVVGVSTKEHAKETFQLLSSYFGSLCSSFT